MEDFEPVQIPQNGHSVNFSNQNKPDAVISTLNTPLIPELVYNNLPKLIAEGCNQFEGSRERDVYLTGALTVLSGCFPNLVGIYDRTRVWPNFNCLVIAPPASGKGAFKWAKELGKEYHKYKIALYMQSISEYEAEFSEYQRKVRQGETNEPKPTPPFFTLLFVPADISAASFKQTLQENEGRGIVFETETDSLSGTLGQDWGNYSDLIRKSFHHENISSKRKAQKEYVSIDNPKLSIALTGTPDQVKKLIPNTEDGLYSRFIYYVFKEPINWRDVSPVLGSSSLNSYFDNLSFEIKQMILFYEKEGEIAFDLTPIQWKKFNITFERWQNEVYNIAHENMVASIRRLGLITFRIAMILSAVRNYSRGEMLIPLECDDIDFDIAMKLAEVYKKHALIVFDMLPGESHSNMNANQRELFYYLNNYFTRQEASEFAQKLAIPERTLTEYLDHFIECKLVERVKRGLYRKLI